MEVYITDENLNDIGIIDDANTIWSTQYNDAGEFELYLPYSSERLLLAQKGMFCYKEDASSVMVIDKIQTKTDIEAGDFLVISGKSAESLLGRRIVWQQTNINETSTQAVTRLLNENLMQPSNPERKMDIIKFGEIAKSEGAIQRQLWGENLLDSIKEILENEKMGFRVRKVEKELYLDIFSGIDRSEGNKDGNSEIIFSEEYDNLINSEYTTDNSDYKNVALVSGEGEGTATKTCEVGQESGIFRREMYSEKGDISSNEGSISEQEYDNILKGEGLASLKEAQLKTEINAELLPKGMFKIKEDYDIGDIVTVKNKYGIASNVRITGITENEDENGKNLVLSCEKI